MELNTDFTKRVLVHSSEQPWMNSPMPGVERRMLDRLGDEVARATTIVRYAPGSQFSSHVHTGGEEFIVLDGVFQDEHGDFPAGTYVRNPPQTSHTPGSEEGCTIFVKLWQFDPEDRTQFRKDMEDELGEKVEGVRSVELHRDAFEAVYYFSLDAGASLSHAESGGTEMLVIEGTINEGRDQLKRGSWLRLPEEYPLDVRAGEGGAKIWVKTGHLHYANPPAL